MKKTELVFNPHMQPIFEEALVLAENITDMNNTTIKLNKSKTLLVVEVDDDTKTSFVATFFYMAGRIAEQQKTKSTMILCK